MRKSIIPVNGKRGLALNPCIIELAAVTLIFALCCAATLEMLAAAYQRAQEEQKLTRAVSAVQSLCETYSAGMDLESAASEVFGNAQLGTDGMSLTAELSLDGELSDTGNSAVTVTARETVDEQIRSGVCCGSIYTLSVSAYSDGEPLLSVSASRYIPYYRIISAPPVPADESGG